MTFKFTFFQWDVNECSISPCLNGGQCYNEIGSFECICADGFEGIIKTMYLDHITGLKCISCANKLYLPNLGPLCELETDECENHFCQNDATCVDGTLTYSCNCSPGFT